MKNGFVQVLMTSNFLFDPIRPSLHIQYHLRVASASNESYN